MAHSLRPTDSFKAVQQTSASFTEPTTGTSKVILFPLRVPSLEEDPLAPLIEIELSSEGIFCPRMSEDGILRLWGKVRGLVTSTPEDMAARSIQEVKTLLEQERKSRVEENREFSRKVREQYDKNIQELAKQGRTDEASKKNLFVDGVYDRTEPNSALWFPTEAANDEEYDTRQLVGRLFLKVPLQDFFSL